MRLHFVKQFLVCVLSDTELGDAVVLVRQTAAVVVSLTRETAATAHYVKQMSSAISESNRLARNSKKSAQKMRSLQSEFAEKMSSAISF
jgi:methyl-accepting chemotaxis protein